MMNNLPKINILRLTIEIAVFVAVVVADAYGLVPITQTLFLVLGFSQYRSSLGVTPVLRRKWWVKCAGVENPSK